MLLPLPGVSAGVRSWVRRYPWSFSAFRQLLRAPKWTSEKMFMSPGRTTLINCGVSCVVFCSIFHLALEVTPACATEQTIKFVSNYLITFTRRRFQAFPIQDPDLASGVLDQTGILQAAGGYGNALATSSQHVGDKFLSHQQLIGTHSVMAEQQPAAQALFHGMETVTDSRLRDLGNQCLRVSQQQALKRPTARELLVEYPRLHPEGRSCDLNHCSVRRCLASQEQSNAYHPVISG